MGINKPMVSALVCCRDIEYNSEEQTSLLLVNPIPFIELEFLPTNYSLNIFFSIINVEIHDTVEIMLLDKDSKIIIHEITTIDDNIILNTIMGSVKIQNVTIKYFGMYSIKICVNGEEVNNFPLYIIKKG